ncbi:class I adenylate-forming enzyme family protein [Streptomyces sp. NPDC002499]
MNIAMLLDMAVAGDPDRVAMGSRGPGTGTTCARLRRTAAGVATVVHRTGARELVFAGVNGPAFPVLLFAAALAGVPLVPVNYRLSKQALTDLLLHTERPLVVADEAFAAGFEGVQVQTPEALLAEGRAADPAEGLEGSPDDPAVLLFTSGTTAAPKAAVLRHRHLSSYILQTVEFGSAAPSDAVLTSVPPYHVAGVGSVLSNLYAGRRIVHLGTFEPAAWLALVRAEGVTSAMVVPTMLARVVEHLGGRPADVPTLRSLAYGGARMPHTVLEAALRAFPDTGFTNAYGLTETSSTIALLGPDDHRAALGSDDPAVRARLRSAGRMVPGVEARIRDETGAVLPPGAAGQLWVRGPQVSGEYKGSSEHKGPATTLDGDGWFHTRDLAHFDDEGYLFIEGRADDTIIRGGENIAPAEVEDVLLRHDAVREAAVVGVPDEEWGERIAAFVVVHEGAATDAEALRAWVRGRLRGSKTPDVIVFRAELPYTPTGKLLRRELLTTMQGG